MKNTKIRSRLFLVLESRARFSVAFIFCIDRADTFSGRVAGANPIANSPRAKNSLVSAKDIQKRIYNTRAWDLASRSLSSSVKLRCSKPAGNYTDRMVHTISSVKNQMSERGRRKRFSTWRLTIHEIVGYKCQNAKARNEFERLVSWILMFLNLRIEAPADVMSLALKVTSRCPEVYMERIESNPLDCWFRAWPAVPDFVVAIFMADTLVRYLQHLTNIQRFNAVSSASIGESP